MNKIPEWSGRDDDPYYYTDERGVKRWKAGLGKLRPNVSNTPTFNPKERGKQKHVPLTEFKDGDSKEVRELKIYCAELRYALERTGEEILQIKGGNL